MGTLRKLQLEIDRTLKKVTEGLQIFDDYLEQLQGTDNANQKEKHEANLKTEIKKLQRYRDQIKTWIAGGEIKDKEALTTARKDIERRMEQFKVCEKEAKTKAYSREGLGAASRPDPRDRARQEMREWLVATVEALTTALEECEAELEELGPAGRPKKGKIPPRTARLEETCSRHRAHVARCEQLLRLLDNEGVGAEELEAVKDSVDDYLARGSESWDEFADPDDAYADVLELLDAMPEAPGAAPPPHGSRAARDREARAEREREERERERQKAAAAAVKAQLAAQGNVRLAAEHEDKGGATAAAGGAKAAAPTGRSLGSGGGPASPTAAATPPEAPASAPGTPQRAQAPEAGPRAGAPAPAADPAEAEQRSEGDRSRPRAALGGGAEDLAARLGGLALGEGGEEGARRALTPLQTLQILSAAAVRSVPLPSDSQWAVLPPAARPAPVPVPASYPSLRLGTLDTPAIMERLDAETLFFIFYHLPGTEAQLAAAAELKRQAWRFHREHGAWFQRHEEPRAGGQPGDDWERGTYIYFDNHIHDDGQGSGWCYRLKQDFLFQYKALEDELQP